MRFVSPEELPKEWAFVEVGLERILKRTKENWTPAHVKQALNENRAYLFVRDEGFVILTRGKDEWTSDPHIHVWAMWFEPTKAKELRGELVAWLDGVSGKRWKFSSPRMGWHGLHECEIERIIWRRRSG